MTTDQLKRGKEIEAALVNLYATRDSLNKLRDQWEAGTTLQVKLQSVRNNGYANDGGVETSASLGDDHGYLISIPLNAQLEAVNEQIRKLETELMAL